MVVDWLVFVFDQCFHADHRSPFLGPVRNLLLEPLLPIFWMMPVLGFEPTLLLVHLWCYSCFTSLLF